MKHDFPFVNPHQTLPSTFLSFVCLENSCFHNELLHYLFPGLEVRLTTLSFPGISSSLPILRIALTFAFFQSSDQHDLLKIIKRGLAMTLASSLRTHGCIPSGPMHLCLSKLFKCSLTRPSSTKDKSSLLQAFLPVSWGQGLLKVGLSSKDQGEEDIEYLGLFHALCHHIP